MKVVRLENNAVIEILPIASLAEAEPLYHPDILAECVEASDEVQPEWVYTDGVWSKPTRAEPFTPPPSVGEHIATLEAENRLLKARNQALAERGEFIEDVIAEMAMDFYA